MKKTILAIAAVMMMSVNMMAQDADQKAPQNLEQKVSQQRQFDQAEMSKQRTEQMAKEYGLNEEQTKQLLTLNTEYAGKLPMMMGRGPRGGQFGERPQAERIRPQGERMRPQGERRRMERPDSARQGGDRRMRGQRPMMNREEMMKNMEAYNGELKKIMTPEQFEKYTENTKRRMQEGPRREEPSKK